MKKSDFGDGQAYCLGLFLAHAFQLQTFLKDRRDMRKISTGLFSDSDAVSMWFNGAADHLFGFDYSCFLPGSRNWTRAKRFREKCLEWRMPLLTKAPTLKNAYWAIEEAKELLRIMDNDRGVATKKAIWS